MQMVESTHPLCGVCGRPVALLVVGGEVITADGSVVVQGGLLILQRHPCQAPADVPPPEERRGVGRPPRTREEEEAKVLAVLSAASPYAIRFSEVNRSAFAGHMTPERLRALLGRLRARGLVTSSVSTSRGRAATVWALTAFETKTLPGTSCQATPGRA